MSNRNNCRCGSYGALRSLNRRSAVLSRCTCCGGWNNWNRSACSGCGCNNCSGCNSRSGCGCNNCSNCNSRTGCGCNNCSGCNSRSGCGCNNCCSSNSRSGCGCNNCSNCNSRTGCGCCDTCDTCTDCFATADCPECTTCSGNQLFFTGRCGAKSSECACTGVCTRNQSCGFSSCNACSDCGSCDSCNSCCSDCCDDCCNDCCNDCCDDCCSGCGSCCDECSNAAVAAEFVAIAPESEIAGGALNFRFESGNEDAFTIRPDGIRMRFPGRYIASYNFLAPAGNNISTMLSLALNGTDLFASQTFAAPAVQTSATSATGQAMFEANPGDKLTLNTSAAIEIPRSAGNGPVATLIIYRID